MNNLLLCNTLGDCIPIDRETLIEQAIALGIFDPTDGPAIYANTFGGLLKRAGRLLAALDSLAADKGSEAVRREYLEARREVEVSLFYHSKMIEV